MAFKDEWIPQNDTMPADASVVNMIADEVIRIDEEGGGANVDVVDNLNSNDTTKALSANQGRILNEKKLDAGTVTDYISGVSFFDLNEVSAELAFFDKNGNDALRLPFDKFMVQKSTNPITSGAVYDAIGDIDTMVNTLNTIVRDSDNIEWVRKNVDSAGNTTDSTTRISTQEKLYKSSGKKVYVQCPEGYKWLRRYFNSDGSFNTEFIDTEWFSGNLLFEPKCYSFVIILSKTDNSAITIDDAKNFSISYHSESTLIGKTWLTLGDSITARGWYQDMIVDDCEVSYVNYGIGGTTIAVKYSSTTNAFCQRYVDMQDECDFITVWGGVNDFISAVPLGEKGNTSNTTFYGALKNLIEGLLTKYPSKKIGFICTTPINHTDDTLQYCYDETNIEGHKLVDYCDAIIDICNDYSIPVLDLYRNSGFNQFNINIMTSNVSQTVPDGLHPSKLGMQFVKKQILDFLKTKLDM